MYGAFVIPAGYPGNTATLLIRPNVFDPFVTVFKGYTVVLLRKSTLSPDEGLKYAVETPGSKSMWQS